jgi:flagellar motor switch protein FliG
MAIGSNIANLTGAEKVAVLLLALGKSKATGLLRRLDPEEIKILTRSSTNLKPVGANDVESLVEEFAQKFSNGVKFMGTEREMRDLLSDVLSEEEYNTALYGEMEPMVAPLMQAAAAGNMRDDQIWDKVSKVKVEELRAYLINEHPQTIGVILSKLDSETAAKIVSSLPAEMRPGILVRMLGGRDVDPDALMILEDTLGEDLLAVSGPTKHGGVADILNRLEKAQSEDVLKSLAEIRPDDVKVLKNMLFTFDDMITLAPPARTLVLDQVPIEKLVMALRGTDSAFQNAILASLAARSRRMVEAELAGGGAGPPREVQEARRFIVDTVLRMNSRGDIQIRQPENLSDVTQ